MDVSPEALVDAIEAVTGTHPGHRRAHASGVVATGILHARSGAYGVSYARRQAGH